MNTVKTFIITSALVSAFCLTTGTYAMNPDLSVALKDPERFKASVSFAPPGPDFRKKFIQKRLKEKNILLEDKAIEILVSKSKGYSYSDLEAFVEIIDALQGLLPDDIKDYVYQYTFGQ